MWTSKKLAQNEQFYRFSFRAIFSEVNALLVAITRAGRLEGFQLLWSEDSCFSSSFCFPPLL